MLVGFVAVRILPEQTGDVGRRVLGQRRRRSEQRVELGLERRIPAEMRDQAVDIVLSG